MDSSGSSLTTTPNVGPSIAPNDDRGAPAPFALAQCPVGWTMSSDRRVDGTLDTYYLSREGRRLNSLAAVLRYLRVRRAWPPSATDMRTFPAHVTHSTARCLAPCGAPVLRADRCERACGAG